MDIISEEANSGQILFIPPKDLGLLTLANNVKQIEKGDTEGRGSGTGELIYGLKCFPCRPPPLCSILLSQLGKCLALVRYNLLYCIHETGFSSNSQEVPESTCYAQYKTGSHHISPQGAKGSCWSEKLQFQKKEEIGILDASSLLSEKNFRKRQNIETNCFLLKIICREM